MLNWILALLILYSGVAFASSIDNTGLKTINKFWVLEDPKHQFNSQTALLLDDIFWTELNQNYINQGFSHSTMWFKFSLTNNSDQPLLKLIDINYPLLDFVTLYEIKDQHATTLSNTGDNLPFSSRNINHPNFVSVVTVEEKKTHQFLLKIKSNAPIQTEIKIWSPDEFQSYYRAKTSLTFLYLGVLLWAAVFNLAVYIFIREKTYLVYGLYVVTFSLLMASQDAILFEYIFPNNPSYHSWSQLILGCFAISLTSVFNLLFLKLDPRKNGKALYLMSFIPLLILASALFINYIFAIKTAIISTLIILPACFFIGLYNSKYNINRLFFLAAWSWLTLGIITFSLARLGFIPFNSLTNHAIQIGSTLELLTFAIALARRLYTEKSTRIQAQKTTIDSNEQSARLQQELLYNAMHNEVSGLPNRNGFSLWIDTHIAKQQGFSIVLMRLSHIDGLDKTLGRDISNYVIKEFALSLNHELKSMSEALCLDEHSNFFASNLTNTTFAFIINNINKDEVKKDLDKLINNLNKPITINKIEIDPLVLTGFSCFPMDAKGVQNLLRNASIALDHANQIDNLISCYDTSLDTYNERQLLLINELKTAITQNHMELYYQPLIDTKDDKIIGAEALIRWPHPNYGMIMPDEFIDIAEQSGSIQTLSLWVLKKALLQLEIWQKDNSKFLMSINISAHNIQNPRFVSSVCKAIKKRPHLTSNIVLEITETQMMTKTKHTLKNLWALNELGFNIAIDDFGTGYSNLGYLKKLPANELKIDKSFVLNIETDQQNRVLVQTAIQMAHNLGMIVVAEGVESEHCFTLLKSMGCDLCQGYHFSRPVPANAFNKLMKNYS